MSRAHRARSTAGLAALLCCLLSPVFGRAQTEGRCEQKGRTVTCRIDQPEVRRPFTDYPTIVFRPGDVVRIKADGCVQTGGRGRTWKRYVDPSGPNADRLYHGLILIPGMRGLTRIKDLVARPYQVPTTLAPGIPLHLRLGYEDDNYDDNGYYAHDDGTDDQCKNVGNAWVLLEILRQ
jgi:hypothetical protein